MPEPKIEPEIEVKESKEEKLKEYKKIKKKKTF